jgi:hypothetical protein
MNSLRRRNRPTNGRIDNMSLPTDPTQTSLTRASLLQKYLLLHSQRDALLRHPEYVVSSTLGEPPCIAAAKRPATARRRSSSDQKSDEDLRPSSMDKLLYPGYAAQFDVSLIDVNQQIKVTLTELGNLRNARNDQRFRIWVQTRILDAERQINHWKTQINRRRSIAHPG